MQPYNFLAHIISDELLQRGSEAVLYGLRLRRKCEAEQDYLGHYRRSIARESTERSSEERDLW